MKIGIIDLGTNTFNLLIAKVESVTNFRIVYSTKIPVKLGEGGINEGIIKETPFMRGINAMKEYAVLLQQEKVDEVFAFATSAIRGAKNGRQFCEVVVKETGIEIEIIDGNKEAELICKGVRMATAMGQDKHLIMDIGGGSTEFIIANDQTIFWKKSFDIGVSRLKEKFKHSDPIKKEEVLALTHYFDEQLIALKEEITNHTIHSLIGSSGSFDTFFDLINHKFHSGAIDLETNAYDFKLTDFFDIHESLLLSNKKERINMEGMIEMRADMIVLASICTHYVLSNFKIDKMKLSRFALKEGILSEILN